MNKIAKKFSLALINILLIIFLATNMMSASTSVPSNSLFWDARLSDLKVTTDSSKIVYDVEGTGYVYLIKSDTEVLSNAEVTFFVPALNYSGNLTENSPGIYSIPISESIIITPEMAAQNVGTLYSVPLDMKLNDNKVQNTSISDYLSNINVAAQSAETYEIPLKLLVQGKVLADTTPLSNKNLIYSLPEHNYSNTVQTSSDGTATVLLNEKILITVSGGNIVTLDTPIQLPGDSDVVAFWDGGGGGGGCTADSLSVSVSPDRTQFVQNEWVKISGTVKDNCGNVINNANVKLTIKEDWFFGSTLKTDSVNSGSDGSYSYDYLIPGDAKSGQYKIESYATKSGYGDGSSSMNFQVIAQPKIKEITYNKYLDKFKSKGNNIVFNRGKTSETIVWLEGDVITDKHNIRLDISDPGSVTSKFVKWTSKSEWWGWITYRGAVFEMDIPIGNPVGKYKLDAKLYYNSNTGERDFSKIDGGSLTSNFYAIFDTALSGAEKESYAYGSFSDKSEYTVWFYPEEEKISGRWMGKIRSLPYALHTYDDKIFSKAIAEVQGETSEKNAVIILQKWVNNHLTQDTSISHQDTFELLADKTKAQCADHAALLVALTRSVGIPSRAVAIDSNPGAMAMDGGSWVFHTWTEFYLDDWYAVDSFVMKGPVPRSQLEELNERDYGEKYNDVVIVARENWNSNEVGD